MRGDNLPDAGVTTPDFTVRVSSRARRVRLVMTADHGLEVMIPRGFDRRRIPELLESKKDWIKRATARMEAKRWRLEAEPPRLPKRIVLQAIGEEWEVEYRARPAQAKPVTEEARPVARERSGGCLVVTGDIHDFLGCKEALCRWLSRKARQTLVPELAVLAQRHRLDYGRVSVRWQRTRWASCSRQGTICLNARLLFLPPEAVEYVLLHELCHTVEMNHSPRFWTLLGYLDANCRIHRRLLRTAGEWIPTWLDHELEEPEA